jgi:agmatine/peptidylarginine deiminase
MKKFILSAFVFLLASVSVKAANTSEDFILKNKKEATTAELLKIQNDASQFTERIYSNETPNWRPAEDYANFKYVLLSSEAGFAEASQLRYTIAKNLPEGVKLVLLVPTSRAEQIKAEYSKYISPDRIVLAKDTNIDGGFWARDAFPYPVVNEQGQLSLVGAKYYRTFRSSPAVASSLSLNMSKNNFTFVGGNLLADENGVCFTINSERKFTTTENDLRNIYGCKDVHYLRHISGIGDVDEVMKPIGNNTIITNTPEYVNDFKAWGYNVVMIPAVPNSYRTYVNSLMVGKTVFMPTYGIAKDLEAQKVYESLGYTVHGIRSNTLSDQMHGSVHCQSMAYPAIDEQELLSALGLEKIQK